MPLIECPDCKKQISAAATTCPYCDRLIAQQSISEELKKAKKEKSLVWLIGLFVALVVAYAVVNAAGWPLFLTILFIALGVIIFLQMK